MQLTTVLAIAEPAEAHRSMSLLLAGKTKGRATLAEDIQWLISPEILHTLNCMLTVGRRAPDQALAVLNIAAQLIQLQLLLVLLAAHPPHNCSWDLYGSPA